MSTNQNRKLYVSIIAGLEISLAGSQLCMCIERAVLCRAVVLRLSVARLLVSGAAATGIGRGKFHLNL